MAVWFGCGFKPAHANAIDESKGQAVDLEEAQAEVKGRLDAWVMGNGLDLARIAGLTSLSKHTVLPDGLEQVSFSENDLTSIPSSMVWPETLKTLIMHSNKLSSFEANMTWPSRLSWLDVSDNALTILPNAWPPGLKTLLLDRNFLANLPAVPLPRKITTLDLSNNNLALDNVTEFNIIVKDSALDDLDLSHNVITNLGSIIWPEHLRRLDLSDNLLQRPPIDMLWPVGLQDLGFDRNPWGGVIADVARNQAISGFVKAGATVPFFDALRLPCIEIAKVAVQDDESESESGSGSGSGSGHAGSGSSGFGCEYIDDGECDEPENCPFGTDTKDCWGSGSTLFSGSGAAVAAKYMVGMRVRSYYISDGSKSGSQDNGKVIREGPDSDGAVRIKFDDDVVQYVPASWITIVGSSNSAGPGSGSGSSGFGCEYIDDGECDEPENCPFGTDTKDCWGSGSTLFSGSGAAVAAKYMVGMRVRSYYISDGSKSGSQDNGKVIREGPDSDGAVRIKFDDDVVQYVPASWITIVGSSNSAGPGQSGSAGPGSASASGPDSSSGSGSELSSSELSSSGSGSGSGSGSEYTVRTDTCIFAEDGSHHASVWTPRMQPRAAGSIEVSDHIGTIIISDAGPIYALRCICNGTILGSLWSLREVVWDDAGNRNNGVTHIIERHCGPCSSVKLFDWPVIARSIYAYITPH